VSKQFEAKARQGYVDKVIPCVCSNCEYFASDLVEMNSYGTTWTDEKNKRCLLGGFAVKKMSTCHEWSGKKDKQ